MWDATLAAQTWIRLGFTPMPLLIEAAEVDEAISRMQELDDGEPIRLGI